jgi:hypothetical protein
MIYQSSIILQFIFIPQHHLFISILYVVAQTDDNK